MSFERCLNRCPKVRLESLQVGYRLGHQDDGKAHSGQNIARTADGQTVKGLIVFPYEAVHVDVTLRAA